MDFKNLNIVALDHQGRGIAKREKNIFFITNALVGEVVDVLITKKHKQIYEGEVERYVVKSDKRVTPKCPYYSACGGCDLMHMGYIDQLDYKELKVKEIMDKFCEKDILIKPIIKNPNIFNYRNKTTFKVNNVLGFYKKKSNSFVEVSNCLISDEKINKLVPLINSCNLSNVFEVIIRTSRQNDDTIVIFDGQIDLKSIKNIDCKTNVLSDKTNDESNIIERLGNFNFIVSKNSFFQVNTIVAEKLYQQIIKYGDLKSSDIVLDLYCGTGSIGIYISALVKKVIGIEINKGAIIDANLNKKLNSISNIEFICGDVSNKIGLIKDKIDLVIVDPPRAGLDKRTIEFIICKKIKSIVYVSCDPITLARDLKILSNIYDIVEITPVDMFSNTHHVECVCRLNLKLLKNI